MGDIHTIAALAAVWFFFLGGCAGDEIASTSRPKATVEDSEGRDSADPKHLDKAAIRSPSTNNQASEKLSAVGSAAPGNRDAAPEAGASGHEDSATNDKEPEARRETNVSPLKEVAEDGDRLRYVLVDPNLRYVLPQDDPTDRRVVALVAYFEHHGVRLVQGEYGRWKVIKPDVPAGQEMKVGIMTFPEGATEGQMRYGLFQINLAYELNASAHLALTIMGAGDALREEIQKLFESYDPARNGEIR